LEKHLRKLLLDEADNSRVVLRKLVGYIRPSLFRPKKELVRRIEDLTVVLEQHNDLRVELMKHVTVVLQGHSLALFTESGILSNEGFFAEFFRKIGHLLFPPAPDANELRDTLNFVFHRRRDHHWVSSIPNQTLTHLFATLISEEDVTRASAQTLHRAYDSLEILVHRVTSIGVDPVIITRYPHLRASHNPVMELNRKLTALLDTYREQDNPNFDVEKHNEIRVLIDDCTALAHDIRTRQHESGASLSLTYLIQRMRQHLARIKVFLDVLEHHHDKQCWKVQVNFFQRLVQHENRRFSLRELVLKNIGVLAYQITEHGGKTGEHYITHGRKDYFHMLRSAMGGGLIVGFLSIFKVAIYYLHAAPFGTAFLYSMNYSLGFIGIHLTHSTLATKQPAMTASRIAASLDNHPSVDQGIEDLAVLIVKVFRSQFVAFVGNIFIAFPVAFLVAQLYFMAMNEHISGDEKAWHMIHELHPWDSLSLFHAGIAGVCLFLAGIISGYYDNAVVYRKIPERLFHHPVLRRILPIGSRKKFSEYIGNNLGSLAGNFTLGIFLGSIGTLGFIFGLPIDIRHITFASANFGLAIATLGPVLDASTIGITIAGILLIGFMNFTVSFSLALLVAVQSRRVAFGKARLLFKTLAIQFFKNPFAFLLPPKETEEEEEPSEA
jgi:site-specific recombinase